MLLLSLFLARTFPIFQLNEKFCHQISAMPEPNLTKTMAFALPEDLSARLEANHATESELWVKVFKKKSGVPSVSWNDVVVETLRWGWIDGVKKSLDDRAYLQRITPRKARSSWSKRNTEHAERLIAEGRMKEPGLVPVRAAKADGRWENAYLPPSEAEVPADFVAALADRPKAKRFFQTLNKSSRYAITYGSTTAKKPETRQRRFEKFVDMLDCEEKPGFGFRDKRAQGRVALWLDLRRFQSAPLSGMREVDRPSVTQPF